MNPTVREFGESDVSMTGRFNKHKLHHGTWSL